MSGDVCALVGGQFGSEGKGLIAGHIAREYDDHVRVGAANAGHTLYTPMSPEPHPGSRDWERHVMQQIPCAAYANPDADLYVGPGALISPEIFARELRMLSEWRAARGLTMSGPTTRKVIVDARAHVIRSHHVEREAASDLMERIGSTSTTAREGIGAAQAARIMREADCVLAADYFMGHDGVEHEEGETAWMSAGDWADWIELRDVPMMLRPDFARDRRILLEGTQGASLSLTTGTHPYITSRNTTAAGLCADAGIAPGRVSRVILVVRTFPIRVAGNSGPFWHDSDEIVWESLGVDPENERTTVTKKVRRVATFSMEQLEEAAVLNGATEIALTFCDYMAPELKGCSGSWIGVPQVGGHWKGLESMVNEIERVAGVPVTMLGTGPHSVIDLDRPRGVIQL